MRHLSLPTASSRGFAMRLFVCGLPGIFAACDKAVSPLQATVATISITASQIPACQADTVRYRATALDANGRSIPGTTFGWSSQNPAVATVDQAGLVRATGSGQTVIKASAGGVHGDATFTVRSPQVVVGYRYPSLFIGDTAQLKATAIENSAPLSSVAVSWVSRNAVVATLDAIGVVTGRSAGVADISAIGPCGVETRIAVSVIQPRAGVTREVAYLAPVATAGGAIDNLKTIMLDGTGARQVSVAGEHVSDYAWSRDGARLLITYAAFNGTARAGSYVVNADGTGEAPLGLSLISPDWSPDNMRLVYRTVISPTESDLYTVRADGGDVRRLSNTPGNELDPQWSPDGRQVLYIQSKGNASELWVVAADSSNGRHIALPFPVFNPRWSPDGKAIAFDNGAGIFAIDADGTRLRALSNNCVALGVCNTAVSFRRVSWSPNGKLIAFARYLPFDAVDIANADGTLPGLLDVSAPCCAPVAPVWSPDSRRVVLGSGRNALMTIPSPGSPSIIGVDLGNRPSWRP